jgi:SAM-dependent methyltransferase
MYSIADYGAMIADEVRMDAFVRALRQAVKPGAVVIDIGTGTGIFALLACRFGARRVYAIEPSDAIQVAREIAAANGCADRIEFIQAMSTQVTLSERADVIISDLGGVLPWFQQHIPSISLAWRRLDPAARRRVGRSGRNARLVWKADGPLGRQWLWPRHGGRSSYRHQYLEQGPGDARQSADGTPALGDA